MGEKIPAYTFEPPAGQQLIRGKKQGKKSGDFSSLFSLKNAAESTY
jgi:hypothetical protein